MGKKEIDDALEITMIVSLETGDVIKIGDSADSYLPKLLRALRDMHEELEELRADKNKLTLPEN